MPPLRVWKRFGGVTKSCFCNCNKAEPQCYRNSRTLRLQAHPVWSVFSWFILLCLFLTFLFCDSDHFDCVKRLRVLYLLSSEEESAIFKLTAKVDLRLNTTAPTWNSQSVSCHVFCLFFILFTFSVAFSLRCSFSYLCADRVACFLFFFFYVFP